MSVMNIFEECYTPKGHLIGMLDRDQRTVVNTRKLNSLDLCPTCSENSLILNESQTQSKSPRRSYPRSRNMPRVKKVLAVVTYLLIVIPNVWSAPVISNMEGPPFWVQNETSPRADNITAELKQDLVKTAQTQARIACNKANSSLEEYTKLQFHMTPDQVHQRYNSTSFNWLPSKSDIPKQFGEDVVDGFSRSMEDETIHLYHQFQKIGVGIEQVINEYDDCRPNGVDQTFCNNFSAMRDDLKALLHELNLNIGTLGLTQKPDVTRDIMPEEDRQVNETRRRIRNWAIYRDYVNALEYTIKAFDQHL